MARSESGAESCAQMCRSAGYTRTFARAVLLQRGTDLWEIAAVMCVAKLLACERDKNNRRRDRDAIMQRALAPRRLYALDRGESCFETGADAHHSDPTRMRHRSACIRSLSATFANDSSGHGAVVRQLWSIRGERRGRRDARRGAPTSKCSSRRRAHRHSLDTDERFQPACCIFVDR